LKRRETTTAPVDEGVSPVIDDASPVDDA